MAYKKHIGLIVKAINSLDFQLHLDEHDYEIIVKEFADGLQELHPKFDRGRFYESVGLEYDNGH